MSSGRKLRRSASLVRQSTLCHAVNTAALSLLVQLFRFDTELSRAFIMITSLSMSMFLNLSHSPRFVMQNGERGTSSPKGGGANNPLISSAFKRGTNSISRRSFNHLRDLRLLTFPAKFSSNSIFFSIANPRDFTFSPAIHPERAEKMRSSPCKTSGVAMLV
nr:hypothetical protein Iba_chr08aCG8030 [Ipomoea batatas]GMD23639.1 hypothetical protein Iba_chr08bCG7190 [Ipomoea batatas]